VRQSFGPPQEIIIESARSMQGDRCPSKFTVLIAILRKNCTALVL